MSSCKIASIILSAAFGLHIAHAQAADNKAEPAPIPNDSLSNNLSATPESAAAQAIPDADRPVTAVQSDERRLTIALLMPPDNSPFVTPAKIIANGLAAASKTSRHPADILILEAGEKVSIEKMLQKAVLAGADVVVGPLQRSRVAELAALKSLPIPVVTLNAAPQNELTPENLLMMSIATEYEAEQAAKWAMASLPETVTPTAVMPQSAALSQPAGDTAAPEAKAEVAPAEGTAPATTETPEAAPARPEIIIFKQNDEWDERIAAAYERTLANAGVPYVTVDIGEHPDIKAIKERTQPVLSEERLDYYQDKLKAAKALPRKTEAERKARKRAITRVENDLAVERSLSDPPYPVALLALSAQTASIIRSSLPSKMRLWATSTTNPGDPATSSTSTTLAYDLNGLVFTETPLLVRYNAQSFEARFETAMPYSLAAKRLFAYGADAFEVAEAWAQKQPRLTFLGETGTVSYDVDVSRLVKRTPVTVLVTEGHLVQVGTKRVARPGPLPRVTIPVQQILSVKEVLRPTNVPGVKSVTVGVDENALPDAQPTPPVVPLVTEAPGNEDETNDEPLERGVVIPGAPAVKSIQVPGVVSEPVTDDAPQAAEPVTAPAPAAQAADEPAAPAANEAQPAQEATQPAATTQTQPTQEAAQPAATTQAQPAQEATQPAATTQTQPTQETVQPAATTQTQPAQESAQPAATTQTQPAQDATQPAATTEAQPAAQTQGTMPAAPEAAPENQPSENKADAPKPAPEAQTGAALAPNENSGTSEASAPAAP